LTFSASDQRRRRSVSTSCGRSTWALHLSLSIRTVLNHRASLDKAAPFAGTEAFEQSRRERKKIEMRFAHLKRS
jgi:hypothetical protein